MPNVICNTSPLQYLYQINCLEILPALAGTVIVPEAVREELAVGLDRGLNLPKVDEYEWIILRSPKNQPVLPLSADLGSGEAEVVALALEIPDSLVILDDRLGRRSAELMQIPLTGTLGLLLDAKKKGFIKEISSLLDRLDQLRFHISSETRRAVLELAEE